MELVAGLQFGSGKRLPVFLQTEAAECGLASVGMIACYHGHRIDLANWWVLLSVPDQATRLSLWEYSQDETRRHGHHRQGSFPMGHFRCPDGRPMNLRVIRSFARPASCIGT